MRDHVSWPLDVKYGLVVNCLGLKVSSPWFSPLLSC